MIELVGDGARTGGRLALLDATGRVVLATSMQGARKVLDVSQLNGFFTVELDSVGSRITGRVIIQ